MLSDAEAGTATLTRLADGRIQVTQADPIVHITTELLTRADVGLVIDGDLVTLGDIDPVTYRITERGERVVEAVRVYQ